MLQYTFSRREKALIFGFAIFLVFIAWFWFVFTGTTDQLRRIDSQMATTQTEIDVDRARVIQMNNMTDVIAQRKAEGVKPTLMPTYDNLQPLMTQLNNIMAAADTFTLTFDDIDRESADYIKRGVRIDYSCENYRQAENLVRSLAGGVFPCCIDTAAISDPTALTASSSTTSNDLLWGSADGGGKTSGPVTASVHVTFFEKYPESEAPTQGAQGTQGAQATQGTQNGTTASTAK